MDVRPGGTPPLVSCKCCIQRSYQCFKSFVCNTYGRFVSVADKELRRWSYGRLDRRRADGRGLAGERRVLGLKERLRRTARSNRARVLSDDHTGA